MQGMNHSQNDAAHVNGSSLSSSAMAELKQWLSTPPSPHDARQRTLIPNNPQAIAHAQLQALRDSGDERYLFLRCILEWNLTMSSAAATATASSEEELLFHCIVGCRQVLLMKWKTLSTIWKRTVRDYLWGLGMHIHTTTSRTLRMAYFNASASCWKRGWVEDIQALSGSTTESSSSTLSSMEQALIEQMKQSYATLFLQQQSAPSVPASSLPQFASPMDLFHFLQEQQRQYLTASASNSLLAMERTATFLSILLGEFSGGTTSQYHLPLEFHQQAQAYIEQPPKSSWRPLDQCLQMSFQYLSALIPLLMSSSSSSHPTDQILLTSIAVVSWTTEIIGWEWGGISSSPSSSSSSSSSHLHLVRPHVSWREALLQADFVRAMFQVHQSLQSSQLKQQAQVQTQTQKLMQYLRQLLLLLTSLTGPIFYSQEERQHFGGLLLEGILQLLPSSSSNTTLPSISEADQSLWMDSLSMVSRLFANYKLSILAGMPLLPNILERVSQLGAQLLQDQWQELQQTAGDLELMLGYEWREEALRILLDGLVLLCSDPWLLYSGSMEFRQSARQALARTLGPLYVEFVRIRPSMARLEEMHYTTQGVELEEVREEISAVDLEEEMAHLAHFGRLDLLVSLQCMATKIQQEIIPALQNLWEANNASMQVSPEASGLLEESRLVTMYIGHLLTDENEGETPVIPESIVAASEQYGGTTEAIVGAIQTLQQFAHFQATKIAQHPSDPRLSPLLAKEFLWFWDRWALAYILPVDYGSIGGTHGKYTPVTKSWTNPEKVQETVSFIITLCLHYHCHWPQERQVQEQASKLLFAMAKRCRPMRLAMVASPSFRELISFHCWTCGIRHSAPPCEFESTVRAKAGNSNPNIHLDWLRGYQRLPYDIKSKILTALLVGCSEYDDETSKKLLNECLSAIHEAFSSLVHALSSKSIDPTNVDAKEMAALCVELHGGVARAGEMAASERISSFLTPSLPHLSGLMTFYADDLSICESLLRLFRDYAEQFIAVLDANSSLALFQASGNLLKSYSANHCASTRIVAHSTDEEQSYNDILCAIQLLIQLGAKDFVGTGNSNDSSQVTDMIFFGLQQVLPLMTRGLLQYPTLCTQYFSLVGFMMESYAEKVPNLPFDLLNALLDSLLFGMSHHDTAVAKCSLEGLAGIVKEHMQHRFLDVHLAQNPELLDKCAHRLLMEVVFQSCVWDRLEPAGMALLPLAAVDVHRFASVVQSICQQIPAEQQPRLSRAFESLLQPQLLSKVFDTGYEGRQNRVRFKENFQNFCHEVHSFLVLK